MVGRGSTANSVDELFEVLSARDILVNHEFGNNVDHDSAGSSKSLDHVTI